MTPIQLFQFTSLLLAGVAVGLVLIGAALLVLWLARLVVIGMLREPTAEELADQKARAQERRTVRDRKRLAKRRN